MYVFGHFVLVQFQKKIRLFKKKKIQNLFFGISDKFSKLGGQILENKL